MEFRVQSLGSWLVVGLLGFAAASPARADVWVYEVLTLRPDAAPYQADAYVGAAGLIARRHGGLRVDGATEPASADGQPTGRVVGLWRFHDVDALDALLADPSYRSLGSLQESTFDPTTSRSLERVRFLAGPGE